MDFVPHGIIPAMVTPLTDDYRVSEKGLRNLIEHVIKGGVHGIFVVGTSGEFYALDEKEREKAYRNETTPDCRTQCSACGAKCLSAGGVCDV